MRHLLTNPAVGLLAVLPVLLVLAALQLTQAVSADSMAFPRVRFWLTVTSVVLVIALGVVVVARFAMY